MRYLFLSYIFPGPLGAMASWLAEREGNHVIFASTRSRQELSLPNVQRVIVKTYPGKKASEHPGYFDLLEEAARAGKSARSSLELVKGSGFDADMIFCASSNGSALALRQVFPDAFIINFLEEENFNKPDQALLRHNIQSLQILEANMAFAFSEGLKKNYDYELASRISLAPKVIDSSFFNPVKASAFTCQKFNDSPSELVTIFARDLSEEDLFRTWTASLELLKKRKALHIVLLVNGTYTMRRLEQIKLPEEIVNRLYIEAHLRQDSLRDLLSSSILTVFPGANGEFALIESMSCASCPMLEKHKFFFKDGWDSLKLGSLDNMAASIGEALDKPEALKILGAHARMTALKNFSSELIMPRFYEKIEQAYQEWNGRA